MEGGLLSTLASVHSKMHTSAHPQVPLAGFYVTSGILQKPRQRSTQDSHTLVPSLSYRISYYSQFHCDVVLSFLLFDSKSRQRCSCLVDSRLDAYSCLMIYDVGN